MKQPLSCPHCGSRRSLNRLRKKLEEVKRRIATKKRYAAPKPKPVPVGMHTHSLPNHSHGATAVGGVGTLALIGGAGATLGSSMHEDLMIAAGNNDMAGVVSINEGEVDTCVDCGTFYAPNAKELGDELQDEIYKLDPLGAMAEILDPKE
jgi:hypothetical protein